MINLIFYFLKLVFNFISVFKNNSYFGGSTDFFILYCNLTRWFFYLLSINPIFFNSKRITQREAYYNIWIITFYFDIETEDEIISF